MLSTKPVLGYKCMACDRPLDRLDQTPGPYLPTKKLRNFGRTSPESRSDAESSRQPSPCTPDVDRRGPQHWYNEAFGAPAEMLPRYDVGPHLPPGGWKGHDRLMGALKSRSGMRSRDSSLPLLGTPKDNRVVGFQ